MKINEAFSEIRMDRVSARTKLTGAVSKQKIQITSINFELKSINLSIFLTELTSPTRCQFKYPNEMSRSKFEKNLVLSFSQIAKNKKRLIDTCKRIKKLLLYLKIRLL
ncbi:hypothetical protein BpHYR1_047035 [Brachionus plicatilis]|uniref:Uncharacterized protein n=1 Tax=Brachionus plicatilis TaxID=10195 RepID=A0A3M7SQE2_BRAPC|nr:hypothetical protein BpHYR1_047035 [Brachionus plicatilis]